MEKPVLNVEFREATGKQAGKKLRGQGMIPGIFYGPRSETVPLALDPKALSKVLHTDAGENVLIDLNIRKGGESIQKVVMLKELQVHPLQRKALHADFYEVSMDVAVNVEIPVRLLGKPEGVKMGGILEQVQRTIQIQCLPGDIPRGIDVDVSNLMIGDSIHVKDLTVEKFKILSDANFTLATVVPPAAEVKPAEEAAEVEGEVKEAEGEAKDAKEAKTAKAEEK